MGGPEMKRKRFTEEQIIGVLKEYAAGASAVGWAEERSPTSSKGG